MAATMSGCTRTGAISSVISGGKFVPTEEKWEDGPIAD
jgi:hypothetical protein